MSITFAMATPRARRFLEPLFVVILLQLTACGGGSPEGDPNWPGYVEDPNEGSGWIGFANPFGPYETTGDSVAMNGTTFIPVTAACPGGLGPGYTVTWCNDATGESGPALFDLNCVAFVFAWWDAPQGMIMLDPGINNITLTSSDGLGNIGRATITIIRN